MFLIVVCLMGRREWPVPGWGWRLLYGRRVSAQALIRERKATLSHGEGQWLSNPPV